MSMGYGGACKKAAEDDRGILYQYMSFNLNLPNAGEQVFDGSIYIGKTCFIEPEIHEKFKRMPSGHRKQIIKRIRRNIPLEEYLQSGKAVIENCSRTWVMDAEGRDMIARRLVHELIGRYMDEGEVPLTCAVYC